MKVIKRENKISKLITFLFLLRLLRGSIMNIQIIEINKLKKAEYNPRKDLKTEDEEYQKIKMSLTEYFTF